MRREAAVIQSRRPPPMRCISPVITKMIRNMKKRILAMPARSCESPPKPKTAAIMATTKKMMDHLSIGSVFRKLSISSCVERSERGAFGRAVSIISEKTLDLSNLLSIRYLGWDRGGNQTHRLRRLRILESHRSLGYDGYGAVFDLLGYEKAHDRLVELMSCRMVIRYGDCGSSQTTRRRCKGSHPTLTTSSGR
jgi:hypothetical protein